MPLSDHLKIKEPPPGWAIAKLPPAITKGLEVASFAYREKMLSVAISLDGDEGTKYIHCSVGGVLCCASDDEVTWILDLFLGGKPATNKQEAESGEGYFEVGSIGMVPNVRHFLRRLKE